MSGLGIVKRDTTVMTVEKLIELFPQKKGTITEETVAIINGAQNDPAFNGDEFINNMLTYSSVMFKNSASMKDYINAVKFCAYLESENDNYTEAYRKARANDQFVIDRINLPTDSVGYRELTTASSRYRKTALVREILTQSDMPLYLMFQGERFKAVQVLANEMHTAPFSKDRISAADKLLTHVKPPENLQVELQVGPNKEAKDLGVQLSEQLAKTITLQKSMLEAGIDIREATKLGIKLLGADDIEDVEVL